MSYYFTVDRIHINYAVLDLDLESSMRDPVKLG